MKQAESLAGSEDNEVDVEQGPEAPTETAPDDPTGSPKGTLAASEDQKVDVEQGSEAPPESAPDPKDSPKGKGTNEQPPPPFWSGKRKVLILLALLTIVGLAIGLGVGLSQDDDKTPDNQRAQAQETVTEPPVVEETGEEGETEPPLIAESMTEPPLIEETTTEPPLIEETVAEPPMGECESLPLSCNRTMAPPGTNTSFQEVDPCPFAMSTGSNAEIGARQKLIDELKKQSKGTYTVEMILSDHLNRIGRSGISEDNSERMKKHNYKGFRFDSRDENVDYWDPQGITGSWDAAADGRISGTSREALLVSWYHKTDSATTKGVRISLMGTLSNPLATSMSYRHMLLVEPYDTGNGPNYRPVWTEKPGDEKGALRAGGIVWFKDFLYVADTWGGFRVFDLSSIMSVHETDNKTSIGVSSEKFSAHGYAFIVPEIRRYKLVDKSCKAKFSFVTLDRSSDPPALVTGEYESSSDGGRILVWDLDPDTGLLVDVPASGSIRPKAAYVGGHNKMQGAARYDGMFYISSSSQITTSINASKKFGRIYRTNVGYTESTITAWAYGAGDLYITRGDPHMIWTAAQHPGNRDVLGIPMSGIPKELPCVDKVEVAKKHYHEKVSPLFGFYSTYFNEFIPGMRAPMPGAEDKRDLVKALVAKYGKVDLVDVLSDLNRMGVKGISNETKRHLNTSDFKGFRLNQEDLESLRWYPQGITGTWDATDDGTALGENREAMIISSCDKEGGWGARVSLVDTTDLSNISYRHLLLLNPTGSVWNPEFEVEHENGESFHAGGIVWIGNYLYAADVQERFGGDTGLGFRVFDLKSIIKLPKAESIVWRHKYAVLEVARFQLLPRSCSFKFNSMALDRSSDPPALVTAENRKKDYGRVAVWDIHPNKDGFLEFVSGELWSSAAWKTGEHFMQGAVRYNGEIFVSTSSQGRGEKQVIPGVFEDGKPFTRRYGVLYRFRPGSRHQNLETDWILGPEDLYVDRGRNLTWTPGEWPGFREVVGLPI